MKKSVLSIITVVIIIILVGLYLFADNSKDVVQLWANYDELYDNFGKNEAVTKCFINKIIQYCDSHDIELELNIYGEKIDKPISQDQYLFKRNVAIAKGNAIVLSSYENNDLFGLRDSCIDFTKFKNYKYITENARSNYYIPLFYQPYLYISKNDLLVEYDIDTEKGFYTFEEYLQLLEVLEDNGAQFKLNTMYFYYMLENCKRNNNTLFLDNNSVFINNDDELANNIVSTINQLSSKLLYYKESLPFEYSNLKEQLSALEYIGGDYLEEDILYDQNTNIAVDHVLSGIYSTDISNACLENKIDKFKIFSYFNGFYPGILLYVNEKVTNEKIFDLVNYILHNVEMEDIIDSYGRLTDSYNSLYFIQNRVLPMNDTTLFKRINGMNFNFEKIINYTSKPELDMFYDLVEAVYCDNEQSSQMFREVNSKSYLNTQIDLYIRNYLYKCMDTYTLELVFNDENQKYLKTDIIELISKIRIYLD